MLFLCQQMTFENIVAIAEIIYHCILRRSYVFYIYIIIILLFLPFPSYDNSAADDFEHILSKKMISFYYACPLSIRRIQLWKHRDKNMKFCVNVRLKLELQTNVVYGFISLKYTWNIKVSKNTKEIWFFCILHFSIYTGFIYYIM